LRALLAKKNYGAQSKKDISDENKMRKDNVENSRTK
jgi:hypothetical protein